jgi:hypothetical protein
MGMVRVFRQDFALADAFFGFVLLLGLEHGRMYDQLERANLAGAVLTV